MAQPQFSKNAITVVKYGPETAPTPRLYSLETRSFLTAEGAYTEISKVCDGFAAAKKSNGRWVYLREDGMEAFGGKEFSCAGPFSDGIAWTSPVVPDDYLYAIDDTGRTLFRKKALLANIFNEGYSVVLIEDQYFLVDKTGSQKPLPRKLFSADPIVLGGHLIVHPSKGSANLISVKDPSTFIFREPFADILGGQTLEESRDLFLRNRVIIRDDGYMNGVATTDGNIIMEPSYSYLEYDGDMLIASDYISYQWLDENRQPMVPGAFGEVVKSFGKDDYAIVSNQMGDRNMVVDREGQLTFLTYANMGKPNSKGFIIARDMDDEGWRILDKDLKPVSPKFSFISNIDGGDIFYAIGENDEELTIDSSGKVVLPSGYQCIIWTMEDFVEAVGPTYPTEAKKDIVLTMTDEGVENYDTMEYTLIGFNPALLPFEEGDSWGAVNVFSGKVIANGFDGISLFHKGDRAIFRKGEEYGFMNGEGQLLFGGKTWKSASIFSNLRAFVSNFDGKIECISEEGNTEFVLQNVKSVHPYYDYRAVVEAPDSENGTVDSGGTLNMYEGNYTDANPFVTRYHMTALDKSTGQGVALDEYSAKGAGKGYARVGLEKFQPLVSAVALDNSDVIPVQDKNGKWAIAVLLMEYEEEGADPSDMDLLTEFEYDSLVPDGKWFVASKDEKWGFVSSRGNVVIPFEYDYIAGFGEGKYAVVGKWDSQGALKLSYISRSGILQAPFEYTSASLFNLYGRAAVSKSADGEDVYIIDESFNATSTKFRFLFNIKYSDFWIAVNTNGQEAIVDGDGKVVIPFANRNYLLDAIGKFDSSYVEKWMTTYSEKKYLPSFD